jgi:hypothetical protein
MLEYKLHIAKEAIAKDKAPSLDVAIMDFFSIKTNQSFVTYLVCFD